MEKDGMHMPIFCISVLDAEVVERSFTADNLLEFSHRLRGYVPHIQTAVRIFQQFVRADDEAKKCCSPPCAVNHPVGVVFGNPPVPTENLTGYLGGRLLRPMHVIAKGGFNPLGLFGEGKFCDRHYA
jgi:hypothetical protein